MSGKWVGRGVVGREGRTAEAWGRGVQGMLGEEGRVLAGRRKGQGIWGVVNSRKRQGMWGGRRGGGGKKEGDSGCWGGEVGG